VTESLRSSRTFHGRGRGRERLGARFYTRFEYGATRFRHALDRPPIESNLAPSPRWNHPAGITATRRYGPLHPNESDRGKNRVLVDEMGFLAELYSRHGLGRSSAAVFGSSISQHDEPAIYGLPIYGGPKGQTKFDEIGLLRKHRNFICWRFAVPSAQSAEDFRNGFRTGLSTDEATREARRQVWKAANQRHEARQKRIWEPLVATLPDANGFDPVYSRPKNATLGPWRNRHPDSEGTKVRPSIEAVGEVMIRLRMGSHDGHTPAGSSTERRCFNFSEDVATELLIRLDGDEGLFSRLRYRPSSRSGRRRRLHRSDRSILTIGKTSRESNSSLKKS